jgi:predicted nucleotidyltransferase
MKVRQQEGWEAARKVAQMLKDDFGVERVVLFGSLLDPERMGDRSDIDLAVWGLSRHRETKAWMAANYILRPYNFPPIDLVPIEKAYPYIKAAIKAEGIEL